MSKIKYSPTKFYELLQEFKSKLPEEFNFNFFINTLDEVMPKGTVYRDLLNREVYYQFSDTYVPLTEMNADYLKERLPEVMDIRRFCKEVLKLTNKPRPYAGGN